MEKTTKINLGCGEDYKEDYLNVDNCEMFPNARVDWKSDIKDFDAKSNTIDEILLSHVVMYLRPEELQPLLVKWLDFLKEGGKLVIETADIKDICRNIALSNNNQEIYKKGLINLFGRTDTGPHTWGWYPASLLEIIMDSGFSRADTERGEKKPDRDFKITAWK